MERWIFEKLEVEGCDIVATRETVAERERVKRETEMQGEVLPFLGLELLEEGAREAGALLQRERGEKERDRKEKMGMMREIEKELGRRENRLAQG